MRRNGSINHASSNACSALSPRGRKLGKADPARWAPDAVEARTFVATVGN